MLRFQAIDVESDWLVFIDVLGLDPDMIVVYESFHFRKFSAKIIPLYHGGLTIAVRNNIINTLTGG